MEQLKEDYRELDLSERERAILDYSVKITENAPEMTEEDTQSLRDVGLSDEEILEVAEIASWFNYINRLADALNVELEPNYKERPAPGLDKVT